MLAWRRAALDVAVLGARLDRDGRQQNRKETITSRIFRVPAAPHAVVRLRFVVREAWVMERRVRSRKIRVEDARRAQVILMLAHGDSFSTISATIGCYPDYINRWKQRFETERLTGLRATLATSCSV